MLLSNLPNRSSILPAPARLNLFQRLVRQWDTLHPYNGVQAMRVRGQVNLDDCRRAWETTIEALGLGRIQLDGDRYHYVCLDGQTEQHTVQLGTQGTTIDNWISEELNRPFEADQGVPFRPILIHDCDGSWLGLAYQHWVADSTSIRRVMRDWFARLFDPKMALSRPLRAVGAGYFELFGPHHSSWRGGGALLAYLRWCSQFRRVQRIENPRKFAEMTTRFVHMKSEEGLIDRLSVAARSSDATVNDLFLVAVARVCAKFVPTRVRGMRRDLAIGTIVDLRPKSPRPMSDVFNLLLGFTSVLCRPDDLKDISRLVSTISHQTRRQKTNRSAESSWIRILGGLVAGRFLDRKDCLELYRKRVALAGACSNVNLNRDWPARYFPDPLTDYVRAAPTGPTTPVVFTPTTLGSSLGVGLTYRESLLPDPTPKAALEMFLQELTRLA
jgi:hypothetical protein